MKKLAWLNDVYKLLFPKLCSLCQQDLLSEEEQICTTCLLGLPFTNFHRNNKNALSQKLKGRFDFQSANSLLYFNTESQVQQILHQIKYNSNEYLAEYMGKLMGERLKESYQNIDLVVPVPLHKRRIEERGYNQSERIGRGFVEVLGTELSTTFAHRIVNTPSQTNKNKNERFENMKDAFQWKKLSNKNILLLDDVITTGATMDSLINAMPKEWNNSIQIISLAAVTDN
jgi:ComF family protein